MSRCLFSVNLGNIYSQYAALIRWKDWTDMLQNSSLNATKKNLETFRKPGELLIKITSKAWRKNSLLVIKVYVNKGCP